MKTDIRLQRDVLDQLAWEPNLDAATIGVTVDEGIVTLTGHVPSYAEKLAAEQAAERVHGVRAVAHDLEVRPAPEGMRTDADIARAVVDALGRTTTVPHEHIQPR